MSDIFITTMRLKDKKTKIIATISDLRCDIEFLRELYANGMNGVRLNTAHQTQETTLKIIKNVRKVSDRIAIIIDTKGPEIRTSKVPEAIALKKGDVIKVSGGAKENVSSRGLLYVDYKNFAKEIPVNTNFLIDDGDIEIKILRKRNNRLVCRVMNDGAIKSFKSVNVPDIHVNLPPLTEKDAEYILFAIKNGIDFISHSFVRNKEDVLAIQKILDKHKSPIKILAKIENQEGVDNIDEILDYAYGIIIARGDLAVEIPAEDVPIIQKKIIKKCIARQKPVITATQMLHSMIKNPRPTRAEVSDIANAVLDGTDGLWLSGETAYGDYPVEAVKVMAKTAKKAEAEKIFSKDMDVHSDNPIVDYLAKAAVLAAEDLLIKEIIINSRSAFSAEVIASYRSKARIFVECFDARRARELALTYGVNAHFIDVEKINKPLIKYILEISVERGKLKKDDLVIFLTNEDAKKLSANSIEICEVGKYL